MSMWTKYHTVQSIQEALSLLDVYQDRARIIAGGTDLLLELEHGKRPNVDCLIDITRIPNIDHIQLEDGIVKLGALVNHNHVVASDIIQTYALSLAQASWEVGAPQIRNRATIAGNLITGSSANDTITPLTVLDASVTLSSVNGERVIALKDFYIGLRQTVMQANEMLTAITFPALADNEKSVFIKLGLRRAQAISVVNCATKIQFDADNLVASASIALGSVAPTIIRIPTAEQALIGKSLSAETISEVARIAGETPTPIDDVRSTAEYRSEMVKVLVARALRQLALDQELNTLPKNPAMLWGQNQAHVTDNHVQNNILHDENQTIESTINGESVKVNAGQTKTLLDWLRDDVHLKGSKVGCAEGECGACTVFLDDVAVMSCMVAAPRAHGATIITVEGLQTDQSLHPIQDAFVQTGAVQCGYCTPGFIMSGAKLLAEQSQPTIEQIQQSISGNLCRCTGYYKIIDAFQEASQNKMKED